MAFASAVLAYATSCRLGDEAFSAGYNRSAASLLAIIGAIAAIGATLALAMR